MSSESRPSDPQVSSNSHVSHSGSPATQTQLATTDVSPEDSTIPSPHQQPETPPLVCDVESLNQWDISSYAKELLISVIDEYRDPLDNMTDDKLFACWMEKMPQTVKKIESLVSELDAITSSTRQPSPAASLSEDVNNESEKLQEGPLSLLRNRWNEESRAVDGRYKRLNDLGKSMCLEVFLLFEKMDDDLSFSSEELKFKELFVSLSDELNNVIQWPDDDLSSEELNSIAEMQPVLHPCQLESTVDSRMDEICYLKQQLKRAQSQFIDAYIETIRCLKEVKILQSLLVQQEVLQQHHECQTVETDAISTRTQDSSIGSTTDVSPEDSTIPSPHQQPETPPLVCDVESLNQWDISSYAKELLISVQDESRDLFDDKVFACWMEKMPQTVKKLESLVSELDAITSSTRQPSPAASLSEDVNNESEKLQEGPLSLLLNRWNEASREVYRRYKRVNDLGKSMCLEVFLLLEKMDDDISFSLEELKFRKLFVSLSVELNNLIQGPDDDLSSEELNSIAEMQPVLHPCQLESTVDSRMDEICYLKQQLKRAQSQFIDAYIETIRCLKEVKILQSLLVQQEVLQQHHECQTVETDAISTRTQDSSIGSTTDVSPEDSTIPSPHQQPETPPLVCDVLQ
ncbi:uncharacterized protein LOC130199325 [Pseudoliparis swirei]|uniref:uncharacterized protein LOC130199325 n=1 Tax=Pseudoliparis swirei TaxID=2059687 RepID=UPI0024BD7EDB|nr:uncharacterized protein LOC130199325 [Pseudoliparis swirei]